MKQNPYPTKSRDTLDRVSDCVAEYGPDDLHNKVPQAPSAPAASPAPSPKSPEGLK